MGSSEVVDPDGVGWTVRRRWYPWRRALSLRGLVASTPNGKKAAETEKAAEAADTEDATLPRNVVLKVLFVVLAAIAWVVYGVAKVLFYGVVVVLFLVGSSIELVAALAVMPVTLLLRLLGRSRWPVEIDRAGEHFETRRAADFAEAGQMRDALLTDIGRGVQPCRPADVG